jgi:excisionase family DNA binding protein
VFVLSSVDRATKSIRGLPEAAEILGIGRSKLYELLEAEEIASVWIGRCRRIPVEALHAFVASRPSSGIPPEGDEPLAG